MARSPSRSPLGGLCQEPLQKNGDHYWVEAHAAPVWEKDQLIGYMSVRRKPARDKVKACESAYRKFREHQAKGLCIRHGSVVSKGICSKLRKKLVDISVSGKLLLACSAAVILILATGLPFLNGKIATDLTDTGQANLTTNVSLIRTMIEIRLNSLKSEAARLNFALDSQFGDGISLDGTNEAPQLRNSKGDLLNNNIEVVDNFTKHTGAVATVFAATGDDFIRITTSLKKEDGERAAGTLLGKSHPAYLSVKVGKSYQGQANLFGKQYFTSYTPITDKNGKIIGLSFIGMDITTQLAELKAKILALKVGKTGYYYVLDANPGNNYGTMLIHPAKEGSNLLKSKDASGHEFIREILERKRGVTHYLWMNPELGDKVARQKVVVFETLPDANWVIAGGTYMDEFDALSHQISLYIIAGGLTMMLVLIALLYSLVRRLIITPLQNDVLPTFRALSAGHYDSQLDVMANDEIGQVRQGLETMQNRLGFEVSDQKRVANEMTRIKIALDSVSTPVRIADPEGVVIYANRALIETLRRVTPALQAQNSAFNLENFIGSSIGTLYPHPDEALQRLATLTETIENILEIGGRVFNVTTSPVFNREGERLGSVGEWLDRTDELAVEREVADIVQAAKNGDFDKRLNLEGKNGFFKQLSEDLNALAEVTSTGLNEVAHVLQAIAQGDLTQNIQGNYTGIFRQLKDDTNTTVERLQDVMTRIKEASESIDTAAKEISAGNSDLSIRTEQQAASLEETATSIEELNSTVKQNAENARLANELAKSSNETAVKGGDIVKAVITTMSGIQDSSKKIADIIGVIDSIAFQTNILALNAAVEAAKAGSQGRGFAVVATEVRNLAHRSATAAKEIKALITESVDKVHSGAKLVDQAGQTMDQVVSSFWQVANLMSEISHASREQSSGIEQVTLAVGQMDEVTQHNAALVEEAAAAAEGLEEQAWELVKTVSVFKLSDDNN